MFELVPIIVFVVLSFLAAIRLGAFDFGEEL